MRLAGMFAVGVALAAPALGQVEARTATPDEVARIESGKEAAKGEISMKSPMLLELPIKSVKGKSAPAWMTQMKVPIWSTRETNRYVCDPARVRMLTFSHGKPKKDLVAVKLAAIVGSGWFRQDLDVTIALLDGDGKELARKVWDDETVGNDSGVSFGGRTKTLTLEAKVPKTTFDAWLADEGTSSARLLLEVQGEDPEE